jgi:adenine-specific DNA-methyltransferase
MPELIWLGDHDAKRSARRVPYRLLQPVSAVGDPAADNLLIQGDNLQALKALLPFYAGRVKCIFIDPPYNTQSAFEHYDDNLEHSQWLSMMYPRLELLRDLLSEEGSIWLTIDDNEAHYLKVLLDEVFGRSNFVANVVWQKKSSPQSNATWLSDSHDHVLCFAKNKAVWRPNKLPRTDEQNAIYKHSDEHDGVNEDGSWYGRGPWFPGDFTLSLKSGQRGKQFAKTGESENLYPITTPSGRKVLPAKGRAWAYTKSSYDTLLKDKRIYFGKEGSNKPCIKRFLAEVAERGVVAMTTWHYSEVGENRIAMQETKGLVEEESFSTPKPEALLQRVLQLGSDTGDLVLDSFLGSGTTAAVAQKMGRRWIGIEMGDHAQTHCFPRLKKVVEGEQGGISEAVAWKGGGGFRFMKLGEPVFLDDGRISPEVRFAPLAGYLWFLETGAPHAAKKLDSPVLGSHGDTSYALLYNGILGDKRPDGGNVLTQAVWQTLRGKVRDHAGPWVIYGEATRLSPARLKALGIVFKQIPYDIRMR